MEIPLHFGNRVITLQVPAVNVAGFITPKAIQSSERDDGILKRAIDRVQRQLALQLHGRSVGVLLPDGTRDLPLQVILPLLLPLLKDARKILFFICTGSHRTITAANEQIINYLRAEVHKADIREYEVIAHDCQQGPFRAIGSTVWGTEIQYHKRLDEVDVFVILSEVKHHYFAGYSNPIKNMVPGLCAFKTIEQNHSLTFDVRSQAGVHPLHSDPDRRDNPLAADQYEAFRRITGDRPAWALTTVSNAGTVQWAEMGLLSEVSARAFDKVDQWNIHYVKPVRYMVVSSGGLPNDVDLYIAQRALELTSSVVMDGGEILFIAACPDRIGSERTRMHFEDKLKLSLEEILGQKPSEYYLFEHKPYRFALLIRRLHRLWLYSEIDDAVIRDIHMHPCVNPQKIIQQWIEQDSEAGVLLVDKANKLLIRPETASLS